MKNAKNPIARAVAIIGSQAAMALAIGTSQQNVSRMLRKGRATPHFAPRVERATGGAVSRQELCPDIEWGDALPQSQEDRAA